MKTLKSNLFKKILLLSICLLMAITGIVADSSMFYKKSTISKETVYYDSGDGKVKIEVLQRQRHEEKNSPIFAIGDIVMQTINYKKIHATENVELNLAIYRIVDNSAFYYKPNTADYGKLTSLPNANETEDCIRFTYAFVKAAKWGIKSNVIYHTDNDDVLNYMNSFLNEKCYHDSSKTVGDYLNVKRCKWLLDDSLSLTYQMHSKQFTSSHYLGHDGKEYHSAVWASSQNIDKCSEKTQGLISAKNWSHSGFIISNNKELYEQNKLFVDITMANYDNREQFAQDVLTEKAKGNLKYVDEHIEMYFTPMSRDFSDCWSLEDNPVAKYFEKLSRYEGRFELYINMYNISEHSYSNRMLDCLETAFVNNSSKNNVLSVAINGGLTSTDPMGERLNALGTVKYKVMTHAKDYMFYFEDTDEYVVICSTANVCEGEAFWKANQTAVFKESGENHQIFDSFVKYHKISME